VTLWKVVGSADVPLRQSRLLPALNRPDAAHGRVPAKPCHAVEQVSPHIATGLVDPAPDPLGAGRRQKALHGSKVADIAGSPDRADDVNAGHRVWNNSLGNLAFVKPVACLSAVLQDASPQASLKCESERKRHHTTRNGVAHIDEVSSITLEVSRPEHRHHMHRGIIGQYLEDDFR
jgi:hypothetical protein